MVKWSGQNDEASMKTVLLSLALLASSPEEGSLRDQVRDKMTALIKDTKTLQWFQKTWATKDGEEEKTSAECFWAGPEKMRLNVKEGRGSGATALYHKGKVIGFQPGMFSFVKLSYDVRDQEVLGLRGGDLTQNGFFDDFELVLKQWDAVEIGQDKGDIVVAFKNHEGLPAKMWLEPATFAPRRIEGYENGKAVDRVVYEKVVFNPALDLKIFEP
jgi:outer membrane lipoprotein-sorting protein